MGWSPEVAQYWLVINHLDNPGNSRGSWDKPGDSRASLDESGDQGCIDDLGFELSETGDHWSVLFKSMIQWTLVIQGIMVNYQYSISYAT